MACEHASGSLPASARCRTTKSPNVFAGSLILPSAFRLAVPGYLVRPVLNFAPRRAALTKAPQQGVGV